MRVTLQMSSSAPFTLPSFPRSTDSRTEPEPISLSGSRDRALQISLVSGATGTDLSMKEFGFGLAVAVAIDALLVRCLIVPALMRMTGERNWTMPHRLARITRVRPRPALSE